MLNQQNQDSLPDRGITGKVPAFNRIGAYMHTAPDPAYPPKHQYSIVVEIEAPIERCFVAASAEKDMMAWVPKPRSIVYDQSLAAEPYGPGASRTVTLSNGMAFVENVFITEKPHLFGYYIPTFGAADAFMKRYQGRMKFESLGPNRTRLTWNSYFDCPGWRRITEPVIRVLMRSLLAAMARNIQRHLASETAQAA